LFFCSVQAHLIGLLFISEHYSHLSSQLRDYFICFQVIEDGAAPKPINFKTDVSVHVHSPLTLCNEINNEISLVSTKTRLIYSLDFICYQPKD